MKIRETILSIPVLTSATPTSLAALMPHAALRRWDKGAPPFFGPGQCLPRLFSANGHLPPLQAGRYSGKAGDFHLRLRHRSQ